jgi:hypothetical protein
MCHYFLNWRREMNFLTRQFWRLLLIGIALLRDQGQNSFSIISVDKQIMSGGSHAAMTLPHENPYLIKHSANLAEACLVQFLFIVVSTIHRRIRWWRLALLTSLNFKRYPSEQGVISMFMKSSYVCNFCTGTVCLKFAIIFLKCYPWAVIFFVMYYLSNPF